MTAAFTRSWGQTGVKVSGLNWSPFRCFMKRHSGAVGCIAHNSRIRLRSGVPPISTNVVNPPNEKPNKPIRPASRLDPLRRSVVGYWF